MKLRSWSRKLRGQFAACRKPEFEKRNTDSPETPRHADVRTRCAEATSVVLTNSIIAGNSDRSEMESQLASGSASVLIFRRVLRGAVGVRDTVEISGKRLVIRMMAAFRQRAARSDDAVHRPAGLR